MVKICIPGMIIMQMVKIYLLWSSCRWWRSSHYPFLPRRYQSPRMSYTSWWSRATWGRPPSCLDRSSVPSCHCRIRKGSVSRWPASTATSTGCHCRHHSYLQFPNFSVQYNIAYIYIYTYIVLYIWFAKILNKIISNL